MGFFYDQQAGKSDRVQDVRPADSKVDLSHIYSELNLAGPQSQIAQSGNSTELPTDKPHKRPVIVLDPGHSGKDISSTDPQTGLHDHDYPNFPEINEAWDVAQKVGSNLEAAGYDVVYTKKSALDSVSLRQRADIAEQANAALAVSIHDDHGEKFDSFGKVYAQNVGEWRGGTASNPKAKFTNQEIAEESQAAALNFVTERSRAEGRPVQLTENNFADRPGIDPGNLSQVQLYAGAGPHPVPWVYNEVGGEGYGPQQEAAYVLGLTKAIEKSVPLPKAP